MDSGRIGIAGQAIGIAQASIDCAVDYATKRIAFNQPISKLQAIQVRIFLENLGIIGITRINMNTIGLLYLIDENSRYGS